MLLWKQALQQRLTLASDSAVFVIFSAFATFHQNVFVLLQHFTKIFMSFCNVSPKQARNSW